MCNMNFSMFLRRLEIFFTKLVFKERPKISLLIPFSSGNKERKENLKWLLKYYKHVLPEAEIVIGKSRSKVFCKNEALNHAARRSRGRVLVVLDSDAYLKGKIINKCADKILEHLDNHLWYVPYRHLYRLTKECTKEIIESSPHSPIKISSPPSVQCVEKHGHTSKYGHRYGAMCMMFPREAYELLGGFDERFKGWGGEDVALLRALDTLYGRHKTSNNDILHLWHPYIGSNYKNRMWEGQENGGANSSLAMAYHRAKGSPEKMRKLIKQ